MSRISQQSPLDLLFLAILRPHLLVANLWWRLLGKKLRARARMDHEIGRLPYSHARWVRSVGREDLEVIAANHPRPGFCVHVHIASGDAPASVRKALRSVQEQAEKPLGIVVTIETGAKSVDLTGAQIVALSTAFHSHIDGVRAAVDKAREMGAEWLVPFSSSARLPRYALAGYGAHLLREPQPASGQRPAMLYGDEGEIGRFRPKPKLWLKPQWDPRMALSQDYVSRACALAVGPAMEVLTRPGDDRPQSLYELILRMSEAAPVEHVPRIAALTPEGSWRGDSAQTINAVRRVIGARAEGVAAGPFGTVAVQFPLPTPPPTVSVIVATRDRVELLRNCVEGVLHATDYPAHDLIIADNESVEPETLQYMDQVSADPRVSVVRWPYPFNYSAINNFAASHAQGDYLCLLNNDIEVIEPHWLSALVREAMQPGVGAVGARLLYPDRSIQHAGVAIGLGNAAGHAHRALPEGEPGYCAQALIARGASAVTGACLLVARRHFEAVGGLDAENLPVAYNDVDLCLKLRAMGLSNIYTPAATLIHHESKSRGSDFNPKNLQRYMRELKVFQERWETITFVDPWHHYQLDRGSEVYRL